MKQNLNVLHLEDNPRDADLVRSLLEEYGYSPRVVRVDTEDAYVRALAEQDIDLIISDFSFPSFDGNSALKIARTEKPDVPFIFVSGTIGEDSAIESLLNGATDYVLKGRMERLLPAVRRALREVEERSARQKAEQELKDSEASFRLLFASNPHPMWVYDLNTLEFLEVNDAAVHKYGYSRDEFLGMHITGILSWEVPHKVETHSLTGLPSFRSPYVRHRCRDGRVIEVEVTSHALPFGNREADLVVAQDVTERNRTLEALRESEERFRLISENVADLIAVLDTEGRRVYNSPSYKTVFGPSGVLPGTDSFAEIHDDDRDRVKSIFRETVRTGIGQRAEFRFVTPGGKPRQIESQGSVIRDHDGKVKNVVVVSRDVTEKKSLEEQFLRAQRMESIGALAGGVAHDLNNVLAPIMLATTALRRVPHDEQTDQILDLIETSAMRGSEIVRQVLAFGRGSEGRRTVLQPSHVIREVTRIMVATFPKTINLRVQIPEDLWVVSADATQMHQVLLNICVNARDAMIQGGSLTVSAKNFIVDEQFASMAEEARPGQYVAISISDTGSGIPQAILERIFDPFFTTKEAGKGTGLGLSTAKAIVHSHGGFITIESEVERGTSFSVFLPAEKRESEVATIETSEAAPVGHGELILVVEDESALREITRETLEVFGYRVLTAANGAEAVELFSQRRREISVVLTDIVMPVLDGMAAIRVLRGIDASIKVIVTSGVTSERPSGALQDLAVQALLPKPYTAEKLLMVLSQVLA